MTDSAEFTVFTDPTEVAALCGRLKHSPFVTVDTEFIRESTYWAQLCLIQIASPDEVAIIDPLAPGMDLAPFFALMADETVLKVFHAARQDIEIFVKLSDAVPRPLFDTQVAAMVCGFGDQVSYDQLVQRLAGKQIDKSSRFTDWARRPLTGKQLAYAAADVIYLRDVYAGLQADLEERGRTQWVSEEMAILADPATYRTHPEDAWERLKMRVKKPRQLAALQALAAWREREAQQRDQPRGRVLKDDAIYELAIQQPRDAEALAQLRSLPRGFERSSAGRGILEAIASALALPEADLPHLPRQRPAPEHASAAADLLKVLLKMVSEQHRVASRVIATSEDLEQIAVNDEPDVPAMHGWRRELFGELALSLKRGDLALALSRRGIVAMDTTKEAAAAE
ncbi:ribonuclease D [Faunimonas pinastri]|uniref:Ribonuclease D n=1 Tax=Faunimonas pinastri TaxID=1855383 RepID=A0A1H9CAC1_9HYPH|nr:ribonuclease D [Faunimonas pinastri]SEP98104.1 ribonuclease D [Faunimonas pinastri]